MKNNNHIKTFENFNSYNIITFKEYNNLRNDILSYDNSFEKIKKSSIKLIGEKNWNKITNHLKEKVNISNKYKDLIEDIDIHCEIYFVGEKMDYENSISCIHYSSNGRYNGMITTHKGDIKYATTNIILDFIKPLYNYKESDLDKKIDLSSLREDDLDKIWDNQRAGVYVRFSTKNISSRENISKVEERIDLLVEFILENYPEIKEDYIKYDYSRDIHTGDRNFEIHEYSLKIFLEKP